MIEPRKHRHIGVAVPLSFAFLFMSIAMLLAFSAIRVGQGVERDARANDRAEIQSLRTAQAQSSEITNCARQLAAQVADADHEWFRAASDVLSGAIPDRATLQTRFKAVSAHQEAALDAQKAFAANPVLPCPT